MFQINCKTCTIYSITTTTTTIQLKQQNFITKNKQAKTINKKETGSFIN